MKYSSYASSEGSDEPAHPRKIASALTAHIHGILISKAGHLGIRFIYHTSVDVKKKLCTPTLLHAKISLRIATVLSAPLFLERNIKR